VLDAYALISESRISVEFVAQLVSAVPSLILISFTVAGCPLEYSTLEELSQFTKNSNRELLNLKDAINSFMDKTNFYELSIKPMENTWRTNSIRDIKAFFRIIDSPIYNEKFIFFPLKSSNHIDGFVSSKIVNSSNSSLRTLNPNPNLRS
jgi:hypothetical protein